MPRRAFRPLSIVEIARRVAAGEQAFDPAVREFLDSWQSMNAGQRAEALGCEPRSLDPIKDACLAAVVEYLAEADRVPMPAWAEAPCRFLTEPFFAGGLESLKATLIVESPAAFRRRLIFVSANGLSRPCRTIEENSGTVDEQTTPR